MAEMRERIAAEVRHILLRDWDPIGVQAFPDKYRRAAIDEYDSHIDPIIAMLSADKSRHEIANFLYDAEVRNMGGRRDRGPADAAAARLVELRAIMTPRR